MCFLFTEEVGRVFTVVCGVDGSVRFDTESYEEDILYDEVSSGLLIHDIKLKHKELLEALSMYYRVFILHEPFDESFEE